MGCEDFLVGLTADGALLRAIQDKRRLWRLDFGETEARVSPGEALERFVIGRRE